MEVRFIFYFPNIMLLGNFDTERFKSQKKSQRWLRVLLEDIFPGEGIRMICKIAN